MWKLFNDLFKYVNNKYLCVAFIITHITLKHIVVIQIMKNLNETVYEVYVKWS